MRKKKDIKLASGDIIIPGELVRYVAHNGGWHVGTLTKMVGKMAAINPGVTYALKTKRNVLVPLSDIQKLSNKISS